MESNFGEFRVRQTLLPSELIELMVFDRRVYDSAWHREVTENQRDFALEFLKTHQALNAHWDLYHLLAAN